MILGHAVSVAEISFTPTPAEVADIMILGHAVSGPPIICEVGWPPGGAVYILDDIPTALQVLELTSSWQASDEEQYVRYAK